MPSLATLLGLLLIATAVRLSFAVQTSIQCPFCAKISQRLCERSLDERNLNEFRWSRVWDFTTSFFLFGFFLGFSVLSVYKPEVCEALKR